MAVDDFAWNAKSICFYNQNPIVLEVNPVVDNTNPVVVNIH